MTSNPKIDSATSAVSFVIAVVALAVPFYLSGISVALALTRIRAASGMVYAADLAGAAAGALAVVPLLGALSLPSGVLVCGAAAAAGAACLHLCGVELRLRPLVLPLEGADLILEPSGENNNHAHRS